MFYTSGSSTHSHSRLVQALSALLGADRPIPHQRFIVQLSKLIDFSGAIELSATLGGVPSPIVAVDGSSPETVAPIQDLLLAARESMLRFILRSFALSERYEQPFYLPLPTDEHFSREDGGISAYQRFYSLHQSEMELQVSRLQKQVRQQLSSHSPALARLAAMDATLTTIMAAYSRSAFAAVPTLLARRFQLHYPEPALAVAEHAPQKTRAQPLSPFIVEMRSVLCAELEIRLQPALGLVESLWKA